MSTGRYAAACAAAGSGLGLVIIAGFAARTCMAITRNGGWKDAREFLGLRGKRNWYKTWNN